MQPTFPVLVVGGSGTIGRATAAALASAGHPVGIHYIANHEAAQEVVAAITKSGGQADLFANELGGESDGVRLLDSFREKFPDARGVALCAGRIQWQSWDELEMADWMLAFNEHCVIPYALAMHAIKSWGKGCRIVFLSSISPKYGGSPQTLHYAASKAALETAMLGLSRVGVTHGARVNGVRSGFVSSPQHQKGRSASEIRERISKIPIGRAVLPEEIGAAFAYLMSPMADALTGQVITVSGGD